MRILKVDIPWSADQLLRAAQTVSQKHPEIVKKLVAKATLDSGPGDESLAMPIIEAFLGQDDLDVINGDPDVQAAYANPSRDTSQLRYVTEMTTELALGLAGLATLGDNRPRWAVDVKVEREDGSLGPVEYPTFVVSTLRAAIGIAVIAEGVNRGGHSQPLTEAMESFESSLSREGGSELL